MQESGLKVNQPASFAVSLNGAKGVIDAKVHSPSGALEECCVTEIDEGNHDCTFLGSPSFTLAKRLPLSYLMFVPKQTPTPHFLLQQISMP